MQKQEIQHQITGQNTGLRAVQVGNGLDGATLCVGQTQVDAVVANVSRICIHGLGPLEVKKSEEGGRVQTDTIEVLNFKPQAKGRAHEKRGNGKLPSGGLGHRGGKHAVGHFSADLFSACATEWRCANSDADNGLERSNCVRAERGTEKTRSTCDAGTTWRWVNKALTISSPLPFGCLGIGGPTRELGHEEVGPLNFYSSRNSSSHPVLHPLSTAKFRERKQAGNLGWTSKAPDQISVGFFRHAAIKHHVYSKSNHGV